MAQTYLCTMLKFYYALVLWSLSVLCNQLQSQPLSLADLSGVNWKPASESVILVDEIITESSVKPTAVASTSLLVNNYDFSNRIIIASSIKTQLSQQTDVAQALFTGYNDALDVIRQQASYNESVEQSCQKDFEYILSFLQNN